MIFSLYENKNFFIYICKKFPKHTLLSILQKNMFNSFERKISNVVNKVLKPTSHKVERIDWMNKNKARWNLC